MTDKSKIVGKRGIAGSGGLVQFRADEKLLNNLTMLAERLEIPVGVLARLWVTERLEQELSFDIATIEAWRTSRYNFWDKNLENDFVDGPIQVIHIVPFQKRLDIQPANVRQFQSLLAPVERVNDYVGRINFDGYETSKQFKSEERLAGKVQVFRSGAIESIRQLPTDENSCIYANTTDDDFIRAVWSYSCALQAMNVQTPVAVFAGFKRMRGCRLKYPNQLMSPSQPINYGDLYLQGISVNNWSEVNKVENAASSVKRMLDHFANSAGLERSMSFSEDGEWTGLKNTSDNAKRKNIMTAKSDVIELPGLNRDPGRIELVIYNHGTPLAAGKIRAPYLEPTTTTRFKCLVNDDEMDASAKRLIRESFETKKSVKFSFGKFLGQGVVVKYHEGLGAGAFDGINIPQERTLWFEIQTGTRGPTKDCVQCGRPAFINTPNNGSLCRNCFE